MDWTRDRTVLVALVAVGAALPVLQYWSTGGGLLTPTPVGVAPFRPTPRYEELALFSAVLIIKPVYSLLSLALIILLLPFKSPEAVALRWGLIFFFVGEGACAVNILLTSPQPTSYTVQVLGVPYTYSHQVAYQIFEIRYSPLYALVLLGTSLVALVALKNKTVEIPKMLLAAGMGPLGFAFLRLIFVNTYRENLVWLTFWEELTELIYMAGIAFVLWAFHQAPRPDRSGTQPRAPP